MKIIKYLCFALLANGLVLAEPPERNFFTSEEIVDHDDSAFGCATCGGKRNRRSGYQLGLAAFNTMDPANWYPINTLSYPTVVPLSLNRNRGFTKGRVDLTPTGITLEKSGNYSVSFSAILTNNDPLNNPLIPVFLITDGVFDPASDTLISGGVASVPFGSVVTIQGTGILTDVRPGTTLSIVATNGGGAQPQTVSVVGWGITAFRIAKEK